ncbi:MAG: hypothetical protein V2A79_07870 [Planctomycetota bacterium]
MTVLAAIGLLMLGVVGGAVLATWIAWQVWRERLWREEWAHACHPTWEEKPSSSE